MNATVEAAETEVSLEQALRDEFTPLIKTVTLAELPAFIDKLMNRQHDYGSICVALGLAAAATAWAGDKHKNGGITGFQAGAVFWEFARAWGSPTIGECGARFVNYDDLLFPQYGERFTAISPDTLKKVQEVALKRLSEKGELVHPEVRAHWEAIALGQSPFGLRVAA